MPVSHLTLVERIARVLAGRALSSNAKGDDPSAGPSVDETWHEHIDDALAILRTLREPMVMAARAIRRCGTEVEAALNVERAAGSRRRNVATNPVRRRKSRSLLGCRVSRPSARKRPETKNVVRKLERRRVSGTAIPLSDL
jgi:hypothetical protein